MSPNNKKDAHPKKSHIFLKVVTSLPVITGNKLPLRGQVLGRLAFRMIEGKEPLREAARHVVREALVFWEKAFIPTLEELSMIIRLEKLFKEWNDLKKNTHRETERDVSKRSEFVTSLSNLFDVAHGDAMRLIKIEEDREFLRQQRLPGRQGTMGGIDRKSALKAKRSRARKEEFDKRRALSDLEISEMNTTVTGADLSPESPASCGQSDSALLSPVAGSNKEDIALNRTTIRQSRMKHREEATSLLKAAFDISGILVVHWDGKVIPDLTGRIKKVDRVPVLVSGADEVKLLGAPKLQRGTGLEQASAVHEVLQQWSLDARVCAMSFDTTASNTGADIGACVLLEQKPNRELLWLACRHHIFELPMKAVWEELFRSSSAPTVPVFERFQLAWSKNTFETTAFSPDMIDRDLLGILGTEKDEIVAFIRAQLDSNHPRDDYYELLKIALVFLGEWEGFEFRATGAVSHARWMSKAIYALKIWLFRDTFTLSRSEKKAFPAFCLYILRVHTRCWFTSPLPTCAPWNDLNTVQTLLAYAAADTSPRGKKMSIYMVAAKKLAKHLWYLSEELVGLIFFDADIPSEQKQKMVERLNALGGTDQKIRVEVPDPAVLASSSVSDFVTQRTLNFFEITGLSTSFLEEHPDQWESLESYERAEAVVRQIRVVNDTAERGVALTQQFNRHHTKDEEQFQYLLQVIEEHRKLLPDSSKETVLLAAATFRK